MNIDWKMAPALCPPLSLAQPVPLPKGTNVQASAVPLAKVVPPIKGSVGYSCDKSL